MAVGSEDTDNNVQLKNNSANNISFRKLADEINNIFKTLNAIKMNVIIFKFSVSFKLNAL